MAKRKSTATSSGNHTITTPNGSQIIMAPRAMGKSTAVMRGSGNIIMMGTPYTSMLGRFSPDMPEVKMPKKYMKIPLGTSKKGEATLDEVSNKFIISSRGHIVYLERTSTNPTVYEKPVEHSFSIYYFPITKGYPSILRNIEGVRGDKVLESWYSGGASILFTNRANHILTLPSLFRRKPNAFLPGEKVLVPTLTKDKHTSTYNIKPLFVDEEDEEPCVYYHREPRKIKKYSRKHNQAMIQYDNEHIWVYAGLLCRELDLIPYMA